MAGNGSRIVVNVENENDVENDTRRRERRGIVK